MKKKKKKKSLMMKTNETRSMNRKEIIDEFLVKFLKEFVEQF